MLLLLREKIHPAFGISSYTLFCVLLYKWIRQSSVASLELNEDQRFVVCPETCEDGLTLNGKRELDQERRLGDRLSPGNNNNARP